MLLQLRVKELAIQPARPAHHLFGCRHGVPALDQPHPLPAVVDVVGVADVAPPVEGHGLGRIALADHLAHVPEFVALLVETARDQVG